MISWYLEQLEFLYGHWPFWSLAMEMGAVAGFFGLGWWVGRRRALR